VRFAVRHPGGAVHEIVVDGAVAIVGRDPSCDLVLNDPKSSRRHAVVESGPSGLFIRDTGSANGVTVNGKRIERAALAPGDVFRIGDVEVTILSDHDAGTVVMEDLGLQSMAPQRTATLPPLDSLLPPPPRASPVPTRAATRSAAVPRPMARPLTVTVLAVLWILSIPFHAIFGFVLAHSRPGAAEVAIGVAFMLVAGVGGMMAYGLWMGLGWARPAQIALAAIGILECPFTIAAVATLWYMLRAPARRYFTRGDGDASADQAEAIFAAAIVAAVVLGGLITAGLTMMARTARTGLP
jgi:FHA domain-containing protein